MNQTRTLTKGSELQLQLLHVSNLQVRVKPEYEDWVHMKRRSKFNIPANAHSLTFATATLACIVTNKLLHLIRQNEWLKCVVVFHPGGMRDRHFIGLHSDVR